MNHTTKKANTSIPLSPEESYLASQLVGRSLFSALQLAKEQELRKNRQMMNSGIDDDKVLKIPIPENLMPSHKVASEEDEPGVFQKAFGSMNRHPLRMLVGGQTGFKDAKKDFYMTQKAQLQKELMEAQKEYINTLSRIKTGSHTEETPCVDAFCSGIAHMAVFGKTAEAKEKDVDIEDGSVKRMLGDMTSSIASPFRPATDLAASGLLRTGTGAAYLTYLLRKKMREEPEAYMQDHLPTRVELQPYA